MTTHYLTLRKQLILILNRLIAPSNKLTTPVSRHQAKVLALITLLAHPLTLIIVGLHYIISPNRTATIWFGIISIICLFIAYLFSRSRHYFVGALIVVVSIGTLGCSGTLVSETHVTFPLYFLTFSTLLGLMILPLKYVVLVIVYNFLALIVTPFLGQFPFTRILDALAFHLIVVTITGVLLYIRHNDLNTIQQQARELVEAQRQNLELELERERAEVLNRIIASVSHDFRTPLSVIYTSLFLLERAQDEDKKKQALEKIRQQSDRLKDTIEEMTEAAKLDNDKTFHYTPIRLNSLVNIICAEVQPLIDSHQIKFNMEVTPRAPEIVIKADIRYIRLAFMHLFDNAVRHIKDNGYVRFRVQDVGNQIIITIQDNGKGIPAKNLPHIFERFYRSDDARNSKTGRTGLGLPIVRQIVVLHGGEISITSEENTGTTVTITVPQGEDTWVYKQRNAADDTHPTREQLAPLAKETT
ncbi:MAG: hypothetical protein D6712_13445 [Chloroflexi bacterium]|nr:MAG: hypothetical protein D6712_13445 [Chloroflexota bacterium]